MFLTRDLLHLVKTKREREKENERDTHTEGEKQQIRLWMEPQRTERIIGPG